MIILSADDPGQDGGRGRAQPPAAQPPVVQPRVAQPPVTRPAPLPGGRELRRCYGLVLASEVPLPDLEAAAPGSAVDVTIRRGPAAAPSSATSLPLGLWRDGGRIGLEVPGIASYVVRAGREVVVDALPGADARTVRAFLLGTVLGALMTQRGHLVLHGNAFRVGDACAVVVGRSGAGKSTLAAELQRRGYDVLADDVVPVDGLGNALPGHPRIKLWEDAVERLGVDPVDLERVVGPLAKYQLPVPRTVTTPLPVRWVYVLERHEGPELGIEPVRGMETFELLHEHTYRNELVHGRAAVTAHLTQCARLAARVRVSRVARPAATMTAEATAAAILSDLDPSGSGTQESA
jgi:hypothetical protein